MNLGSFTPALYYNGRTINFPEDVWKFQKEYPRSVMQSFSASRLAEALNIAPDDLHAYALRWQLNSASVDFKRSLYQWFEWASKGNAWKFARDNTKTALTTLTAGSLAGATSLTVASITGISSGDQLIIRSATDQQLVKVNGAPSGSTINLVEALDYDFAIGVRVRHEEYWPGRLIATKPHPVQENGTLHFDFVITFVEDMN